MSGTVGDLKVGERLWFGRYPLSTGEDCCITWLKATPNCDFISEYVLDRVEFDYREPGNYYGNPVYSLSNILSYLNSEQESWFSPTHDQDMASPYMLQKPGFLYHFDDYELEALSEMSYYVDGQMIISKMRLPFPSEILGDQKFKLFKKKGIRTYMVGGFQFSYEPYWLIGEHRAVALERSAKAYGTSPTNRIGVRPVCRIRSDLELTYDSEGRLTVKPFEMQKSFVFSENEISDLIESIA